MASIFSSLAAWVKRVSDAAFTVISTWDRQATWFPHDFENLVTEGYQKSELVYACIREIAQSASEPTLRVYGRTEEELPTHPLRQLLQAPNPWMSEYDFWEATLTMMNITGNALWEKERSRAGVVVGLWPLRPDMIKVIPGLRGPEVYEYDLGDTKEQIPATDVIHFRYYNPLDRWWGQSPLVVAARAVNVDLEATDYTKLFFQNAAVPAGLLTTKQKLNDDEAQRIRKRWKAYYGGANRFDVAVLDSDASYQQLAHTFKDMDFPELRSISETRICMTFGVPPILIGAKVGLDRSTFSNYGEARISFWDETLAPIYKRLMDRMNRDLLPEFGQGTCRWDFSQVQALAEKEEQKKRFWLETYRAGAATLNEFRYGAGLPGVVGGDVFLRTGAMIEIPAEREVEPTKALLVQAVKGLPAPRIKQVPVPDRSRIDALQERMRERFAEWAASLAVALASATATERRNELEASLAILAAWMRDSLEVEMTAIWEEFAVNAENTEALQEAIREAQGYVNDSLIPDLRAQAYGALEAWSPEDALSLEESLRQSLGSFLGRVGMYAGMAWSLMNAARMAGLLRYDPQVRWAGPLDERTCPGCAVQMTAGERPLSRTPEIGTQDCLSNCRHRIEIRGVDY